MRLTRKRWLSVCVAAVVALGVLAGWLMRDPLPNVQLNRISEDAGLIRISYTVENPTSRTFATSIGGNFVEMIYRVRSNSGWKVLEAWPAHGSVHAKSSNDNLTVEPLEPGGRFNFEMVIPRQPELVAKGSEFQFGVRLLREPTTLHASVAQFFGRMGKRKFVEVWSEAVVP